MGIDTDRSADNHEFCNVESSFAEFEFRHERLPLPDTFPKLHLCYARVLSSLYQQLDHSLIEFGAK